MSEEERDPRLDEEKEARPADGSPFPGDSEMARRCGALDWSATPLGSMAVWPESLRVAVGLVLSCPDPAILLWGPELVQIYNDAYRDVLGEKHPRGLGQRTRDCWPEVWEFTGPIYERVTERGETVTFDEQRLVLERHGRPEETFFRLTYLPFRDGDGRIAGILVNLSETTAAVHARAQAERLEAERALLAREREAERERLRSLILHIPAPVALHLGPEHRFEIVNRAYEQVSGGRDVTGMTPLEAFPEIAGQGIAERLTEVYDTGRPWIAAEAYVHYDRRGLGPEDTWFTLRFEPVRDHEGRVIGVLNLSFDVTDQVRARKRVEEQAGVLEARTRELEESQERLRLSMDAAQVAFWDFDPRSNTTVRSPHHDRFYGYDEPLPLWNFDTYVEHVHPEDRARVADRFARALASEEEWSVESRVIWPDGSVHWVGTQGVVYRNDDGEPVRVVGIITDVTERRLAEAERERLFREAEAARAEAEAANRSKSEFLAVMSHELRTPLNAIAGYVDLVEMGIHGPVTPAQRTALGRVQKSQQHLLGLINEVLNYARLESGAVTYDIDDVPLHEVLAATEALLEPQAQAHSLTLSVNACDASLSARADPEKLRQILLNLGSNAVKFTGDGGRIEIECQAGADAIEVRVSDTGIGIPADKLDSIFEPFVQVRADLTRTGHGTGLGLAISRDLARGMGGDLTVRSVEGQGSTFTVHLTPAAQ